MVTGLKSAVIGSISLLALAIATPASAQGLFEQIFGGLRRAIEAPRAPTSLSSFADPFSSTIREPQQRADVGPAKAFCVRTCDGHFFPVAARAGMSAAESCNAFCPASKTQLFSGSNIDYAVAPDGSRYADLDNAFVYRKQIVAGCSCTGKDAFGLARMDVKDDPTLRPGDIVATKTGLSAFTGTKNNVAEFTPIDEYRGLSKTARDKMSEIKIMPPNPGAAEVTPATITRVRADDRRRVQLER